MQVHLQLIPVAGMNSCSYSWLKIALNAGRTISKCRLLQLTPTRPNQTQPKGDAK